MEIGSLRREPQGTSFADDFPEPPEEDEEIARFDALVTQMGECRAALSEDRTPPRQARTALTSEVGIEVAGMIRRDPTTTQRCHEVCERGALWYTSRYVTGDGPSGMGRDTRVPSGKIGLGRHLPQNRSPSG